MNSLKTKLIFHGPALAVCAALALLIVAPLVFFPYAAGGSYQGLNIAHIGDEYFYLSRGKEALEGKPLGQPFIAEGKEAIDPTFSFVESVLVFPLRVFGISDRTNIVTYYNVVNAIGVFLVAALMYALMFRLSENRLISIAAVACAIGGYTITEAHTLFYRGFNVYGRSVFPYTSSILFFTFLLALYEDLVRRRGVLFTAIAGTCLGLMFWAYFFAWTFSLAILGALGVIYVLSKDWLAVRTLFITGLFGIGIGALNVVHLYQFVSSDTFKQLSFFYYSVRSHAPIMSNAGTVTAVLLAVLVWRSGWEKKTPFILAVIAAGWVALNQQVLTGRTLQYGHYFWYFVSPLSILLTSYFLWKLSPERYRAWFAAGLISVGLLTFAGQQYRTFVSDVPSKIEEQLYMPIIRQLQREPYGVVLTSSEDETPFLITIYTNDDLYWNSASVIQLFDMGRLEEALLVHLFLNAQARRDPVSFLKKELNASVTDEYTSLYFNIEGYATGFDYYEYGRRFRNNDPSLTEVREKTLAKIGLRYDQQFRTKNDFKQLLKERSIDYIVWNKKQNPKWDLYGLDDFKKIVESGPYSLYVRSK